MTAPVIARGPGPPTSGNDAWSSEPPHGSLCVPSCGDRAIASPLERERPPLEPCPFCKALGGVACTVRLGRNRRPLTRWGRIHPSRQDVAG